MEDLRMRVTRLEDRFNEYERRADESATRADKAAQEVATSLKLLLERSDAAARELRDWEIIRKTLAWVGTFLLTLATIVGGVIGWFSHTFWHGKV